MWWAGLLAGLRVGQAGVVFHRPGFGLLVPVPRSLMTQPPFETQALISLNGKIIISLQKATLSVLLQSGADATACSPSGETALSFAACQGQLDAVEQLLEYGADPDITNVVCNMVFQLLY